MKRKLIYIAHPISGDIENNCKKVKEIMKKVIDNSSLLMPIAPYLTTLEILDDNDPLQRIRGMAINNYIIANCIDELWVYGDHVSTGMQLEIELAHRYNKKVVYELDKR